MSNRCRALGAEEFETRFLGRPTVCLHGADASRAFYEHHLTRSRAMPPTAFTLLQDKGSVAQLDGEAHRRRKELFLSLVGPERVGSLVAAAEDEWRVAAEHWRRADRVVLLGALEQVLTRAACRWAGVPLGEPEAAERTRELSAMIDGAGSFGPRNARGHVLRWRSERWLADMVAAVRRGVLDAPDDSILATIAGYTDPDGRSLAPSVAAVELLNVIRPTVAVAHYVVFEALFLHHHPGVDTDHTEAFAHETRRLAPFFPAVVGRTVTEMDLGDARVPAGWRVLLDLYGTNRSPRSWDRPEEFRPERFVGWSGDPYCFVPQGGGDHASGHRCPGEWATVGLLEMALRMLTQELAFDVPDQDLSVSLSRMPAQPASGFVIRRVRPR